EPLSHIKVKHSYFMASKAKPTIAVVIPTIGRDYVRKTLPLTIRNIAASLRKIGVKPFFIIEDSSKNGLRSEVVKAVRNTHEKINLIPALGLGPNAAWEHGFSLGIKKGAFAVVSSCDDYFNESRQFDRLIRPLLRGEAEVVTGGWKHYGRNILSFPRPQYLNEIWVSRLMSYANPNFDTHKFPNNPFLENSNLFQTFSGMIALRPEAFKKIRAYVKKTFESSNPKIKQKLGGWGLEPVRLLAALTLGIKITNVPISARRFEHTKPLAKEMKKFVASRLSQYNDAIDSIREFLIKTNQTKKLVQFEKAAAITAARIYNMRKSTAANINLRGKRRAIYKRMKNAVKMKKKLPIFGIRLEKTRV
ncbi:MAG: hypothetical protein NTY48_04610, partial [Candidatus Diapherotrites archaeon]|nr:hypothetical protein [Candidatus Diapherotrites archaeon]